MNVRCNRCCQEWPRDPALEVPCPRCHVAVGVRCRRPSGHGGNFTGLHAARDRAAMRAGLLTRCPAAGPQSEQVRLDLG
jgi:hypothetical protein